VLVALNVQNPEQIEAGSAKSSGMGAHFGLLHFTACLRRQESWSANLQRGSALRASPGP